MKRNIDIYRSQSCSEEVDGRNEVTIGQEHLSHYVCVCAATVRMNDITGS